MKRNIRSLALVAVPLFFFSIVYAYFINPMNPELPDTDPKKPEQELSLPETYTQLWVKVDSLERRGLTETAMTVANQIYEKASAENNGVQIVKSLIHISKYTINVNDDGMPLVAERIKSEADRATNELKSILLYLQGEMYWQYYNDQRWMIESRTQVKEIELKDIRTWDKTKLITEAMKCLDASLANEQLLKNIPATDWKDILTEGDHAEIAYPTLFDFLANRAIESLHSMADELPQPAYRFEITDPVAFAQASVFVHLKFGSRDTFSVKLQQVRLHQRLLAAHLNDSDPASFIHHDIQRLLFLNSAAIVEGKDSAFVNALEELQTRFRNNPASVEVTLQLAQYWEGQGNKYNQADQKDNQWNRAKALKICEDAIRAFPNANFTPNCKELIRRIRVGDLSFQLEHTQSPGTPFLALVEYRNVPKAYFRIAKIDDKDLEKFQFDNEEENWKLIMKLPEVKRWEVNLPAPADYQKHRVELPLDALPLGNYVFMACDTAGFPFGTHMLGWSTFWVTNLSSAIRDYSFDGNDKELFVMDRNTGQPLKNVSVTLHTRYYDFKSQDYKSRVESNYKTNEQGSVIIKAEPEVSRNYMVELKYGKDRFFPDGSHYQYGYKKTEPEHETRIQLFTDRNLYRPGQKIYFKGIVTDHFEGKAEVQSGVKTQIILQDANYQEVATLELTSNSFGSFSGNFTAPLTGLTGEMQLVTDYGSTFFRVEEYKRPKFEVTFDKVKESFRLNDEVKVTGKAIAYAGSNIDNSKVQYRVIRTASFPYWWWGWGRYAPQQSEMEIAHGESTTNAEGVFEIKFKAIPDLSIKPETKPKFNYRIVADVTDINGETHSATANVRVGYVALDLSMYVPEELDREQADYFKIITMNLNGEFEPAVGTVHIHRLQSPKVAIRNRKWSRPDQFLLSKADFENRFPGRVYDQENEKETWAKEAEVLTAAFDTQTEDSLALAGVTSWKEGVYLVEIETKDKFGTPVKWQKFFTLYSKKENGVPGNAWFWTAPNAGMAKPGERISFNFASGVADGWLFIEINANQKQLRREWVKYKGGKLNFDVEVTEEMRGIISASVMRVRNGDIHQEDLRLNVQLVDRDLKVEIETFRDKMLPGSNETWKLKITGADGEIFAAEMLAGMYDASLDALYSKHNWYLSGYAGPELYAKNWEDYSGFGISYAIQFPRDYGTKIISFGYSPWRLNQFGLYFGQRYAYDYGFELSDEEAPMMDGDFGDQVLTKSSLAETYNVALAAPEADSAITGGKDAGKLGDKDLAGRENSESGGLGDVKVRTNLNELAFFLPHLETNEKGEIIFSFTMPEALTRWNFMALAHTKDMRTGYATQTAVTQKDLMVMPNPPRFLREGDRFVFTAKVSNLSDRELSGEAVLELFDALTMQPVDVAFGNVKAVVPFTAPKGQSAGLTWELKIPERVQAIVYRVKAKAGDFTDGEENTLPILTNRMLVTEAMPMPVRPNQSKTFTFDKLMKNKSTTLRNEKLTLEFTSNPAWYAVQALPYLMEYPYECNEQTFSRFYANSLAAHIANSSPKIKQVFDQWAKGGNEKALLNNLEKNQELKYLLLEETPWVMQSNDEGERKKRVALLFELNRLGNEMDKALTKLIKSQNPGGSWSWFEGGPDDPYITQLIATGMGKLNHLGVKEVTENAKCVDMTRAAVYYLDGKIVDTYEKLIRDKVDLTKNHLGSFEIQYLYMRSFHSDVRLLGNTSIEAYKYFRGQAQKYWIENSRYLQGMIAVSLNRSAHADQVAADQKLARSIVRSLKENSMKSEELGMFWKENTGGYYWWQAPIEFQAMMIEAFDEVTPDAPEVEEMKIWLLKSKQTSDWKTTRATVEACYALLLRGTEFLSESKLATIKVGGNVIDPFAATGGNVEAGTGYFKTTWPGSEVTSEMGKVQVTNPNSIVTWGAMYWQYFEQLDKITPAETPLKMNKGLFLQTNTDLGPVLTPLSDHATLTPGDMLKVRIEIRSDRDLEYVHLKDMRASGFEPVNVLSRYKWDNGLGYYEATRDAATNFFISWLPKGTHVFEYSLRVTHKGEFSNGITTIQCMYAPEFTAHSEGIRVEVK